MPIYEYHCDRCGDFEEMQRITDPALARCPRCKGKIRRLISQTSFQLKGTGWYVTDYARAGNGGKKADKSDKSETSEKSEKSEKSDGGSASDTKAESKTESKSAPSTGEKPTS